MATKHIHADVMLQYAQDAQTTATPWLLWEIRFCSDIWVDCTDGDMHFSANFEYRRKPKMLSVTLANGEVVSWPEPHKGDLDCNCIYYVASETGGADVYVFANTKYENKIISFGLAHLTKEAAEQHSYALFKINNQVAK